LETHFFVNGGISLTKIDEEEVIIELQVKESYIEGEDGVARIHDDVLKKLNAEEGHSIIVESEEDSILVTIYGDNLIDANLISLRPGDRKKLEVSNGDKVKISLSKSFGDSIKKKLHIRKDEDEEEEEK
jgi:formylmethanofuran dehydrogenase subunit D